MSNQITGKEDVVVAILTDILSALNNIKYEMYFYDKQSTGFDVRCLEEYTSRIDKGLMELING